MRPGTLDRPERFPRESTDLPRSALGIGRKCRVFVRRDSKSDGSIFRVDTVVAKRMDDLTGAAILHGEPISSSTPVYKAMGMATTDLDPRKRALTVVPEHILPAVHRSLDNQTLESL